MTKIIRGKSLFITSLLTVGLLSGCGNDPYVTVEKFNKLEVGMTAKEVEKIIGSEGVCEQRWLGDSMYQCVYMAEDGLNNASISYDGKWKVLELWHSEVDMEN